MNMLILQFFPSRKINNFSSTRSRWIQSLRFFSCKYLHNFYGSSFKFVGSWRYQDNQFFMISHVWFSSLLTPFRTHTLNLKKIELKKKFNGGGGCIDYSPSQTVEIFDKSH